jgi:hypothetical protein
LEDGNRTEGKVFVLHFSILLLCKYKQAVRLAETVMRAAADDLRQKEERQLPTQAAEGRMEKLAQFVEQQGQML